MPTFDLAVTPLRDLNRPCTTLHRAITTFSSKSSIRAATMPSPSACTRRSAIDIRGSVGYYCGGMNDGGDDHRSRLGRPRRRREHDVGPDHRQRRCQPVCGCDRLRRPAGDRGQCLLALRHLDEGHRYRRARQYRPYVRPSWRRPAISSCSAMPARRLATRSTRPRIFVRGKVKSLGADCIEKEMRPEHIELLADLLDKAGVTDVKAGGIQPLRLRPQALQFPRRQCRRLLSPIEVYHELSQPAHQASPVGNLRRIYDVGNPPRGGDRHL